MLKATLAMIVGYVIKFVLTVLVLTGVYKVLGTDASFLPDSYEPSRLWLIAMLATIAVSAVLAGVVCCKIGGAQGVKALIVLILVLETVLVMTMETPADRPETRPEIVGSMEAPAWAETPRWAEFAQPVIGAIGVLIGAGLAGRKKKK